MKKYLVYTAIVLAAFVGAFLVGRLSYQRAEARIRAEILAGLDTGRDTTILRDTVTVTLPAPAAEVIRLRDTVYIPLPGDTVPVSVPVEKVQRVYPGDGYQAWVSGMAFPGKSDSGPSLDSIRIEKVYQEIIHTVPSAAPKSRPLRLGVEGFADIHPAAVPVVRYGPAAYVKYRADFFEFKIWGGYDFGTNRGAAFGATAAFDVFRF